MYKNRLFIVMLAAAVFLLSEISVYAQPREGVQPQGGIKRDKDNNPPGPRGGHGTNWENKPGPQGGPGASPDKRPQAAVNQPWEKRADANKDGVVDQTELQQWKEQKANVDRPWEKKADANKDGVVDQAELQQWKEQRAIVDKRWEKKADANKDGVVDKTEMQQLRPPKRDKDNELPPRPKPKGVPGEKI
jgi:hypothetical protein